MKEVIRKGRFLDNEDFKSINKAKRASRILQRTKAVKVKAFPAKQPIYYPVCINKRLPHEIIHMGKDFWEKMKELRISRNMLLDWHFARGICRTHIWRKA